MTVTMVSMTDRFLPRVRVPGRALVRSREETPMPDDPYLDDLPAERATAEILAGSSWIEAAERVASWATHPAACRRSRRHDRGLGW